MEKSRFLFGSFTFIVLLFPSCVTEQEDDIFKKPEFNYSEFEFFKSNLSLINDLKMPSKLTSEERVSHSKNILDRLNDKIGTDVKFPDAYFELITHSREEILETSFDNGWIDFEEVKLNNVFFDDLQTLGFDLAIKNYESKVLSLDLTQEEFLKKNMFINLIKSLEFNNPDLFGSISHGIINSNLRITCSSQLRCAGALVALVAATASLSSCATVLACGGAILLHVIAIDSAAVSCDGCLDALLQ